MIKSEQINRLLQSLDSVLPIGQFSEEIKMNVKEAITSALHDMDVVTRDEFEAQRQVLLKTRQKLDQLEDRLAQLQSDE